MTKEVLIFRLEEIVRYSKKNHMRILIEVEPDFNKIYIYMDTINHKEIAAQILKYRIPHHFHKERINNPIKVTLTSEKMYYPLQTVVVLPAKKGRLHRWFYNPDVKTEKEFVGNSLLYFVSIRGEFDELVKACIIDNVKNNGVDCIERSITLPDDYKFNYINKERISFYKY
jgi:hypothetical protein